MSAFELFTENVPVLLALLATGTFAGLLAGLLGVGGGIVIVPVLYFLFQAFDVSAESAMLIATATSLATIIPTSVSSIRAHHKRGNVDIELLKRWSIFVLFGVMTGSALVTHINGSWLTLLFGCIAILAALNMLVVTNKPWFDALPNKAGQATMASSIGFFSSMVGIGGGTLAVPMLTMCNYPAHKAVGSAAGVGLLISLPAAATMLLLGRSPEDAPMGTVGLVNIIGFVCIVPLTVIFAPIGAKLATILDAKKLKRLFAVVLLMTGFRMLAQTFL